jgi:hypothetical protein
LAGHFTAGPLCQSGIPARGTTAFLPHLSAAAELFVINLVAQHDPETDSKFANCSNSRFPQSFLHEFAPVKPFQLWISLYCVYRRLTPEIAQQSVTLLTQCT